MSIYSGFSTRNLESLYNQYVCEMISLMQNFIVSVLKHRAPNPEDPFSDQFMKSYQKLTKLERQKHLQPNFSLYIQDLASFLKEKEEVQPGDKFRTSPLVTSYCAINRKSELMRKPIRLESPSKIRYRGETISTRESPKLFQKERHLKVYQDQILKSIIKELTFNFQ